ncbi:MAG: DUF1295 domain-containing protein [Pseudomonadota bacterium]
MTTQDSILLLGLAVAWLAYFIVHSVLASLMLKRRISERWPGFVPYYRLTYNVLAVILLLPVIALMRHAVGSPLWTWRGVGWWLTTAAALLAVAGFAWSLRYYDMGEFLGMNIRRQSAEAGHFRISPFHRYVRHPWYFFALIIIWTRAMEPAWLISSVLISLYLVVGSRLEENKLVAVIGEPYRIYRQRVPALFPLPWRYLTQAEALEMARPA